MTMAMTVLAAFRDPRTCDEVMRATRLEHQRVSPRVHELLAKGLIEPTGEKRETRTGRKAKVLALTADGVVAVAAMVATMPPKTSKTPRKQAKRVVASQRPRVVKRCGTCGMRRPHATFVVKAEGRTRVAGRCVTCSAARRRERWQAAK